MMTKLILPALFFLASCGPDAALEDRKTLTADDVGQAFQITVLATADGAQSYDAVARLYTSDGVRQTGLSLPAGDSLTLNGAALTESAGLPGVFATNGNGSPGTFTFVWKHGGTVYQNQFTAVLRPPTAVPATISKGSPGTLQFQNVPTGVAVAAHLNAGTAIKGPFLALPVQVSGGGTGATVTPDLSSLATGPGALTVDAASTATLQSATAAGGGATITVQIGYGVTIGD